MHDESFTLRSAIRGHLRQRASWREMTGRPSLHGARRFALQRLTFPDSSAVPGGPAPHPGGQARSMEGPAYLDLAEYDPLCPVQFAELEVRLRGAMGGLPAEIEHVGSTSVPGLAAKPMLDIDIVVPDGMHN
jgi:hypothetical protein